jgi:hypothetical protein
VPVLAPGTGKVTGVGASGESHRAGVEVIERLLLDRVAGKRGDRTVDQRVDRAIPVLPRAAPAELAIGKQAAPLAGQAADFMTIVGRPSQSCRLEKWGAHSTCRILTCPATVRKSLYG